MGQGVIDLVVPLRAKRASKLIIPLIVVFLNAVIILFPRQTSAAARVGVLLWLENALPSLLPFLVGVNVLMATGIVEKAGKIIEPITRKALGIAGGGAFALAAGLVSGYPVGAKITAELRSKGELSREQALRLTAFCNNAGPLFVIGAVGINMFSSAKIGYFILITHYLGTLTAGFLCRVFVPFFAPKRSKNAFKAPLITPEKNEVTKKTSLLGDAVLSAMMTMLQVGGFIILFRVIAQIAEICGLTAFLSSPFSDQTVAGGVVSGLIEMTSGCAAIAAGDSKAAIIAAAAVISWGGLSVHAQTLAFLSKTDISAAFYILAKTVHAAAAAVFAFALYPLFNF